MSQITTAGIGGGGGGDVTSFQTDDAVIVLPVAGLVKVFGAAPISTTGAGNTITIHSTGGFPWTVVSTATVALAINNGYIMNRPVGGVVGTLPAVAAAGSIVRIAGIPTGTPWEVDANAGQLMYDANSTSGTVLTAITPAATVELLCIVANTTWLILSGSGNYNLA